MVKELPEMAQRQVGGLATGQGKPQASRAKAYAKLFKALGDDTRLQILEMLSRNEEPLCACDIEARFALKQPTISHHLRLLRQVDLISGERRGNWIYYSLVQKTLQQLGSFRALLDK